MANAWLRLWHDMPNDPKWRTIARVSKQPIATVQAVFIHLLVSASESVERGEYRINAEDVASSLDESDESIEAVISAMQGRVLDGKKIIGWEKRQPLREDGAQRGRTTAPNHIYYVATTTATNNYVVKIGISSNPWARVKELQTGSSTKFELLATMKTDVRSEKKIHEFFEEARLEGEWFLQSDALRLLIEKTVNKEIRSMEQCVEFLTALPSERFVVDRSNYETDRSSVVTTDTDTDTDTDIKTDLPLNPPQGKSGAKKFDPLGIVLPDWIPVSLWREWVEFRKALRKPIRTAQGANGAIRELDKFRQQGFTPEQVIRHSIAHEYQGLYPPKDFQTMANSRNINSVSQPDNTIPPGFKG